MPHQVLARHLNSYDLESLDGDKIPGSFSARRLRRFFPKEGMKLAEEQRVVLEQCAEEQEGQQLEQEDSTDITEQDTRTAG